MATSDAYVNASAGFSAIAGETIIVGDTVSMENDGLLYRANAATGVDQEIVCCGLAETGVASGAAVEVKDFGTMYYNAGGLTPGGVIYLGETDGGITQTAPTTVGDWVQVVGIALTAYLWRIDIELPGAIVT